MWGAKDQRMFHSSQYWRSCDSPATRLTRRQAAEIQTKMKTRRAEEIGTRAEMLRLWNKIKKAIQKNRVPCQPLCKRFVPDGKRHPAVPESDASNDQEDGQDAAERRIQI